MSDKASQQDQEAGPNRLVIATSIGVALAILAVIIWIVIRLIISNQAIAQGTGELPPAAGNPIQLVSEDDNVAVAPVQQDGPPPDAGAPPGVTSGNNTSRNLPDEGPNDVPPGAPSPVGSSPLPLIMSGAALVLSLAALGVSLFILLGKDDQ